MQEPPSEGRAPFKAVDEVNAAECFGASDQGPDPLAAGPLLPSHMDDACGRSPGAAQPPRDGDVRQRDTWTRGDWPWWRARWRMLARTMDPRPVYMTIVFASGMAALGGAGMALARGGGVLGVTRVAPG
ncbi:hypothetical protein DPSP01_002177 [Paraphaeosphaeria sporulosa]